jgi:hypothetical protein
MLVSLPIIQADTDHFSNRIIVISGKCNIVTTTGIWLFALTYINKEEITVQAQGENGEKINTFIFPPDFAFFLGHENILIQMENAEGFLFWAQKSLFFNNVSQRVFVICKAGDIWVTY